MTGAESGKVEGIKGLIVTGDDATGEAVESTFKKGKAMEKPSEIVDYRKLSLSLEVDKKFLEGALTFEKSQLVMERSHHDRTKLALKASMADCKRTQSERVELLNEREKWKQRAMKLAERPSTDEIELDRRALRAEVASLSKRLGALQTTVNEKDASIKGQLQSIRLLEGHASRLEASATMMQKARDIAERERNAATSRASIAEAAILDLEKKLADLISKAQAKATETKPVPATPEEVKDVREAIEEDK